MGYSFGSESSRFEHQTRHTKEDALSDKQFELLYEGASSIQEELYRIQTQFIVLVLGRLGLRRGELCHLTSDWVDWNEKMIRIPRHEPCDCGDCRLKAEQKKNHNSDIGFDEAMQARWHPKTESAVREVPFSHNARIELVIERFFENHDEYHRSCQSINRRLDKAVENSALSTDVYPHSLRGTAATYLAGRGLGVLALQSMFGWAQLSTPMLYVKHSGKNTARELRQIHS